MQSFWLVDVGSRYREHSSEKIQFSQRDILSSPSAVWWVVGFFISCKLSVPVSVSNNDGQCYWRHLHQDFSVSGWVGGMTDQCVQFSPWLFGSCPLHEGQIDVLGEACPGGSHLSSTFATTSAPCPSEHFCQGRGLSPYKFFLPACCREMACARTSDSERADLNLPMLAPLPWSVCEWLVCWPITKYIYWVPHNSWLTRCKQILRHINKQVVQWGEWTFGTK